MKNYPQVLPLYLKPPNWLLYVAVLKTTVDNRSLKYTKMRKAAAERANILPLVINIVYSDSRILKYEQINGLKKQICRVLVAVGVLVA